MRVPIWYGPLEAGIEGTGKRMGNTVATASRIKSRTDRNGLISGEERRLIKLRAASSAVNPYSGIICQRYPSMIKWRIMTMSVKAGRKRIRAGRGLGQSR